MVIDSIKKDTITKTAELKTPEKIADSVFADGWYTEDLVSGIDTDFYTTEVSLHHEPFLSLEYISSVTSELEEIYGDSFLVIQFHLNQQGKINWQKMALNPKNKQVYFVLDENIINQFTLPDSDHKDPTNYYLSLKLPYGDFTPEEADDIKERIAQRVGSN